MTFKVKNACYFLIAFLSFNSVFAQTPKYSNEFLAIGVGARALGMSNSVVSTVGDVTSGYWNPAGLLQIKSDFQVGLMHSEYFAGIAKYDYGAFAKPIDSSSALGFSIIRFGVDDIPNTLDLLDPNGNVDYNRITKFSVADYGFVFSYAKKLRVPGLNVGANLKVIHRKAGEFAKAYGFGLDAAAQYQKNGYKFGVMARDITTTFNAWSFNFSQKELDVLAVTGNEIPTNSLELTLPKLIVGAGKTFEHKKFTALAEINADLTFDKMRNVLIKSDLISVDPHLGIEIGYNGFIFLRGGLGNIQEIREGKFKRSTTVQPNMGVGVKIKGISIDYALTNINQTVGLLSNVFSLKFDLNRRPPNG